MPNFTERLKELRIKNNMTQKNLAEKLNVTQTAINYWENGKREPSLEVLIKLAEFFQVSVDYLINSKTEKDHFNELNINSNIEIQSEKFGFKAISVTEENIKKYPEYFNIVFDKAVEMLIESSENYQLYDAMTGIEIGTEKMKELAYNLTNDKKIIFLNNIFEKIEVNELLKTIRIFCKSD